MNAPYNCYVNGHWIGRRYANSAEGLQEKLERRYAPRCVEVKPVRMMQLRPARMAQAANEVPA